MKLTKAFVLVLAVLFSFSAFAADYKAKMIALHDYHAAQKNYTQASILDGWITIGATTDRDLKDKYAINESLISSFKSQIINLTSQAQQLVAACPQCFQTYSQVMEWEAANKKIHFDNNEVMRGLELKLCSANFNIDQINLTINYTQMENGLITAILN